MTMDIQKRIGVLQGDCKFTDDPFVLYTTVLGSCIAVCIFDDVARIGGMNHFLLPSSEGVDGGHNRYGVNSMELLINGLLKLGAERSQLRAKVFGGSEIRQSFNQIGKKNQEFAKLFLAQEGIPCVAENLGGSFARKLKFSPCTGKVRHLLIPSAESPQEIIPVSPPKDDGDSVELF